LLAAALTAFVWALFGHDPGASFGVGSLMMWVNLLLLSWSLGRIFAKKSIAWTVGIIVIKYTVLLGTILLLTRAPWFHVLSAGIGLATFIMATLAHVMVASVRT
jgi:hypothetical protein